MGEVIQNMGNKDVPSWRGKKRENIQMRIKKGVTVQREWLRERKGKEDKGIHLHLHCYQVSWIFSKIPPIGAVRTSAFPQVRLVTSLQEVANNKLKIILTNPILKVGSWLLRHLTPCSAYFYFWFLWSYVFPLLFNFSANKPDET